MTVLRVCMLSIVGVTLAIIIKQWKSDFLPLIRLGMAILLAGICISSAAPLVSCLQNFSEDAGFAERVSILIKALGIALLTQFCAEICRECGENGIAGGVELAGKIEILLLCLPFIREIMTLAGELLSVGGN